METWKIVCQGGLIFTIGVNLGCLCDHTISLLLLFSTSIADIRGLMFCVQLHQDPPQTTIVYTLMLLTAIPCTQSSTSIHDWSNLSPDILCIPLGHNTAAAVTATW